VTAISGWNFGRYDSPQEAMKGIANMFDKQTDGYIKRLQDANKSTEEAFHLAISNFLNLASKIENSGNM